MAINNVTNYNHGSLLQIAYSKGVRNLLSQDWREFEQIKKWKVSNSQARQINFMLLHNTGPASINYSPLGTSGRRFGTAYQAQESEFTAYLKQIEASLALDWDVLDRAMTSPEKYGDPLAIEMAAKARDQRRRIAGDLYGDGTGVVMTAAAGVDDTNIDESNGALVVVTLKTGDSDRGCVGTAELKRSLSL